MVPAERVKDQTTQGGELQKLEVSRETETWMPDESETYHRKAGEVILIFRQSHLVEGRSSGIEGDIP